MTISIKGLSQSVVWHVPVIPALGRWRQEDLKFEARLGYIRPCLNKKNKKRKKKRKEGSFPSALEGIVNLLYVH
jgi:hypothetical protein